MPPASEHVRVLEPTSCGSLGESAVCAVQHSVPRCGHCRQLWPCQTSLMVANGEMAQLWAEDQERIAEITADVERLMQTNGEAARRCLQLEQERDAALVEAAELRDHLRDALQAHADLEGEVDKLEALAASRGLAVEQMREALRVELNEEIDSIEALTADMKPATATHYVAGSLRVRRLRAALAAAPDAQAAELLTHYDRLLEAVSWLLEDSWDLTEDPGPGIRADLEAAREARGLAGGTTGVPDR